jgi:hypothetical protein
MCDEIVPSSVELAEPDTSIEPGGTQILSKKKRSTKGTSSTTTHRTRSQSWKKMTTPSKVEGVIQIDTKLSKEATNVPLDMVDNT